MILNTFFLFPFEFLLIKMMFFLSRYTQRHSFHLVDPSIMPFITAFAVLTMTVGGVLFFHGYNLGFQTILFGLFSVMACKFM